MDLSKTLKNLLTYTIENKGSDLHICPGASPFIRVGGKLTKIEIEPLNFNDIKNILEDSYMLDAEKKKKMHTDHSVAYSFSISGLGRFRACTYLQRGTMAVTIRILPYVIPTLDALGYGNEYNSLIKDFASYNKGLFLILGDTGTGKSSTLAAIIDHLNTTASMHITTIEHPIEYLHAHKNSIVTQKEMGADVSDLKTALKWAVTQNADVIALDNINKNESDIMLTVTAAEEKLVFACMKAVSSIDNASEYFGEAFTSESTGKMKRLSNTLKGVMHQYYDGGVFTAHITRNPLNPKI